MDLQGHCGKIEGELNAIKNDKDWRTKQFQQMGQKNKKLVRVISDIELEVKDLTEKNKSMQEESQTTNDFKENIK